MLSRAPVLRARGQPARRVLNAPAVPIRISPRRLLVRASGEAAAPAAPPSELPAQAINLTDAAVAHLKKMRAEIGGSELLLRVGVKQGGCSGMSYVMDFESPERVGPDDTLLTAGSGDAEGLRLVCDPKSLLYLFGMQLDYSPALIGGGFKFANPNAQQTCGCGTSFSV